MTKCGLPLLTLLLTLLPGSAAMADILWMQNGDRLTGTIEEITDDQISIKPSYSEVLTVQRHAIKRWRLDKQEQPKPLTKTGIPLLDSPDEVNAWLLTGTGDLNIKLKESTKKTNNVNLKVSTELANLDWRYSLDGEYIYETANNVTDSHEYKLKPKLDFFFDDHWFLRSSVDIDYNLIEAGYLEIDYASGPGYRFWNDKRRRLELISQLGLERAYFTPEVWSNSDLFNERIINYPFISLGWDYRQPLDLWQEKFELFSKGSYEKFVDQPSPYLTRKQSVSGSLGLRYYFNDHLRLSWSSELDWDDVWFDYHGLDMDVSEKEWRHIITLGASF
ncbi:DUF481 domain-containing protein [Aeromonas sp. sif0611]|uniref:DUF481 domain-containing protein n=1 Tax=Aeromonas sp. sif0611 TaxID=2854787 RepID=UPI001C4772B2|nr:DUF481 domain-containing protein [Aeromonas sp. sif0611]